MQGHQMKREKEGLGEQLERFKEVINVRWKNVRNYMDLKDPCINILS